MNRVFINDIEKGLFREWFYILLSQTFKIHREGFLANVVMILNTSPDQVLEITPCPWIPWGLHISLSKMAQLIFTHIVPIVFRGCNCLVVIPVIRFSSLTQFTKCRLLYQEGQANKPVLSCQLQPQHQHTFASWNTWGIKSVRAISDSPHF